VDSPDVGVATPGEDAHAFAFTGRASEYFRIWVVSLALSLVTLGVYSAWGKVRKRRYLYHHTQVAGSGFDFRGSPLAILRGRVVAVVLLGGIALGRHGLWELQLAFIALLILLSPWIAIASARFNARNTYYRNVPFDFDARLWTAVKVFLGGGVLAILSLGLAYPWFRALRARFLVAGHRYGATPFTAVIGTGPFALAYLLTGLGLVAVVVLFGGVMALIAIGAGPSTEPGPASGLAVLGGTALLYASYIVLYAFMRARTQNVIANGTHVGPLHLASRLRATRLAWLYVSNVLAVLATLGLATPWATVRLARYRARTLVLLAGAPLASMPAATTGTASATASAMSDRFDVDVGL
jgi:uncharacterized membrane protein YjgN (DUF898 family)